MRGPYRRRRRVFSPVYAVSAWRARPVYHTQALAELAERATKERWPLNEESVRRYERERARIDEQFGDAWSS